jgi:hypothetical protein
MMAEIVVYNSGDDPIGVDFGENFINFGIFIDEWNDSDYENRNMVFVPGKMTVIENLSEKAKGHFIHVILSHYELSILHEYLAKCKDCKWYWQGKIFHDLPMEEIKRPDVHLCTKMRKKSGKAYPCNYAHAICELEIHPTPPEVNRFDLMEINE